MASDDHKRWQPPRFSWTTNLLSVCQLPLQVLQREIERRGPSNLLLQIWSLVSLVNGTEMLKKDGTSEHCDVHSVTTRRGNTHSFST